MVATGQNFDIKLRSTKRHPKQHQLVESEYQRIIAKCGRRFGKTVGFAKRATKRFCNGRRQLYAAPTSAQCDAFWFEVCRSLAEPIQAGLFKKNEADRTIELPGTKQRLKAMTAWSIDTFRGDYCDDLYLDEYQLMSELLWDQVCQPLIMQSNGTCCFAYTPPSLASQSVTNKSIDPRHASKMFKEALADTTGEWLAIHATSHENPYISQAGIEAATRGMSLDSYRREIMAEDDDIELSWLVYGVFNETLCKIQPIVIPGDWPVMSFHDFGSANPAALFVARAKCEEPIRVSTGGAIHYGDYILFQEYCPGGGRSTFEHIQEWKSYGYNIAFSVGGNQTTEDEIRQGYAAHGWPISAPRIKQVPVQIDRTRGVMELNKLWIFDTCWGVLSEISNCMWKLDDEMRATDKIKDDHKWHRLACLRYGLSEFTPETVQSESMRGGQSF